MAFNVARVPVPGRRVGSLGSAPRTGVEELLLWNLRQINAVGIMRSTGLSPEARVAARRKESPLVQEIKGKTFQREIKYNPSTRDEKPSPDSPVDDTHVPVLAGISRYLYP